MESPKTITKNSAKVTRKRLNNIKRRLGRHFQKVNKSQPSEILKNRQTRKLDPIVKKLMHEKRAKNLEKHYKEQYGLFNSNYNNLYK